MSENLTEQEMRQALFGGPPRSPVESTQPESQPVQARSRKAFTSKPLSPRLRVTLNVTKSYEGLQEVFVHDANTLSTLLAETEAKAAAKKQKFRYFELVSVEPV